MREVTFLLILSLLCVAAASAQSPSATINGIVLDPAGAVIAGAEVVIVNDATGVQYTTKTNGDGIYVVPNLPPGPYRIQVSNSGFKTIIKPDIVIHVQDALAINFTLPVGAASEIVTVQGGAPLVNTENAAVSTVIDRNFAESLPLNGRSFNMLLQLTPGVVIAPANNIGGAPGQFSIAGQRTDANSFTVDGVSANFGVSLGLNGIMGAAGTGSAQAFSVLGSTSSLVSVDALQEFRIETSSSAPEFGRSPGGQVALTTRSGTNEFHGGVFDYFRNDVMDANDWFANQIGRGRAPERHNDFGGSFGGAVIKDKTFFFLSYEGARLRLPKSNVIQVPSAYARSVAPNVLAPFLTAFPQPDDRTATPGVYTANFTGVYSDPTILNAGSIRIDHRLTKRLSLFGRYNEAPSQLVQRALSLNTVQATNVGTRTVTAGFDMAFSARLWNTFRANYSKQTADSSYSMDSFGGAVPLNPSSVLGSLSLADSRFFFAPLELVANLLTSGPFARNHATQMNLVDALAVTSGSHQLKFGADYRDIFTTTAPSGHTVAAVPLSTQAFLSTGQAFIFSTVTSARAEFLVQSLSLYGQDTWKITPDLTMTYGLRWEWDPAPSARGNTTLGAWTHTDSPGQLALAPSGTPLWSTTYANFAPRIGVAYKLNAKGDFVLRGGFGVYYDLGVGQSADLATTFPNSASKTTFFVALPVTNINSTLPSLSLNPPYSGNIYIFSPNLTLPRSYQWSVALEKAFGPHVLTATYLGQMGRDLLRTERLAPPNANFGPSSTTSIQVTGNQSTSDYDSLELQYRRPLRERLQMLLNYTWSHSLDDQSDDTVAALSGAVISAAHDRGSSSFDVRHSFSGALTYAIPSAVKSGPLSRFTKDWSVDAVIVARTGFPFNATFGDFTIAPGNAQLRPDLVPGQPFWIPNPYAPGGKSLNAAAFAKPSTIRQGTEGRNDIPGFGLAQVDLSVGRKFPITERLNIQFRADAFNVINHPNFTNPLAQFSFASPLQSQIGQLQSNRMLNFGLGVNPLFAEGGPRSLQLSLRFAF